MATGILRPTAYDPVRSISARRIGKKWAPLPAILAAFIVSGLMHDLIFYYMGILRPTLETTCFFLIHGVCLAVEIVMEKVLNGKFRLPRIVAGPAVIGFVGVTALWLFFLPILRFDIDVKVRRESADFVEFVKDLIRVANVRLFDGK
ncbi:hypothetical protein Vadar_005962 [Vaccinium darrowii]|uniref:Uncharacterized protein n=1 Tax=Vaccinium darrowii TaxID=229202 RepID=A0ACB7YTM0_9ERIC|nr:hypothetical protein Vadar_005962 [Vaccinium darrowii]